MSSSTNPTPARPLNPGILLCQERNRSGQRWLARVGQPPPSFPFFPSPRPSRSESPPSTEYFLRELVTCSSVAHHPPNASRVQIYLSLRQHAVTRHPTHLSRGYRNPYQGGLEFVPSLSSELTLHVFQVISVLQIIVVWLHCLKELGGCMHRGDLWPSQNFSQAKFPNGVFNAT
jgi:hypothetical protein